MVETVFKIGLFSNQDKDFIIFSGLCNNIPSINITLRNLQIGEELTIDKKFFEIPVYIIHQDFFELESFGPTLKNIKESNAPVLCLLNSSRLEITKRALDFHADFWLYGDSLNSPILQSTLKRAEQVYRLKEESQYLKRKFHESEKRFLSAIRSRADAVIVIGHNLLIRYINPACEEQFGISTKFIGSQFPYALKMGQISEIDLKAFTNKTKIVEAVVTQLMWENEPCLTISLHDITEQRKLENELVTFRHVIHLSPIPIMITDKTGVIIYANKTYSEATEYSVEELLGKNPNVLKSGKHELEFYQNLWDTITTGQTWYGQICNKSKNGRLYWEKQLISPVMDNNDEIMFFVCMRIDDLEKKKAEKAQARADTLKSVQELAGGIAHEFSQPLQVLSISMALMEKEVGTSEYFAKADKMINRIIKLVDNLKSITSIRQQEYLSTKIMDIKASSDKLMAEDRVNRILVIDDEKEILDSLTEVLKIHGYESHGVSSGAEALSALEDSQYKLILCDIDMPGMPGTDLFKKIKANGYNGYFVFMTGYEIDEDLDDVVSMADGFLNKPFQMDQLKDFIQKFFTNNTD